MNGPIVIKPDRKFYIGSEEIRCGRTCDCECGKKCSLSQARATRSRARASRKCTCEKKTSETCADTVMKKKRVKKFDEDWENLWKPQDDIIKAQSDKFFVWED